MSSFKQAPEKLMPDQAVSDVENVIENPPTFSQVEKIVMLASPILAAFAGWVATIIARYFPGMHIDQSQLIYVFALGVAAVIFVVLKFLHSKDKRVGSFLGTANAAVVGELKQLETSIPGSGLVEADVVKLLEDHKAQWEADVLSHLPAAVQESLRNLLAGGGQAQTSVSPPASTPATPTAGPVPPVNA